jgi:hypothetical protein
MAEVDVAALIDRIIADARIPSRRERADLRRELHTHFADAARVHGSIGDAIAGFGSVDDVASRLRGVYRAQRLLVHALRIAAGLTAALVAALAIEFAVSRPGAFRNMAGLACLVVVSLVVGHEVAGTRERETTPTAKLGRWLAGFLALAAWEYGFHSYLGVPFSAVRAAAAAGVLVTVAASTAIIMAGADRAFTTFILPRDT